jgi:hypothetical protein
MKIYVDFTEIETKTPIVLWINGRMCDHEGQPISTSESGNGRSEQTAGPVRSKESGAGNNQRGG